MGKVSITGKGEYIPETISDLGKVILGGETEADAFFSKKRIRVSDPFIVGYHPKTGDSFVSEDPKSRWNRVWDVHVKSIRSLEIKKDEIGECSLLVAI